MVFLKIFTFSGSPAGLFQIFFQSNAVLMDIGCRLFSRIPIVPRFINHTGAVLFAFGETQDKPVLVAVLAEPAESGGGAGYNR